MEAVILAGGLGTRLRSVVPDWPKPMAPVAGKPFLEIVLRSLARQRMQRVILSLGYMADKVVSHFGKNFAGMELAYAIEETPLGTGGALRLALEQCMGDHVMVFNGDTFIDVDIAALEQQWLHDRRPLIVGCSVNDVFRYGKLDTDGTQVYGFLEKGMPGPGIINAGCYLFRRDQLNAFTAGKPFSLETDYLVDAIRKQPFALHLTQGLFIDIGVPEDYQRAQHMLANH
jgi:D-glycero-alpha-D-manno-heptose 1-phosphate guanylyltransferase